MINVFSPHLPQWRPLSELNNIDSPYQELHTLSRRTLPAVVIFVPLVADGRPLNKNAREEKKSREWIQREEGANLMKKIEYSIADI